MKTIRKLIAPVLGVVFLIILVAYLSGAFTGEKVPPGHQGRPERPEPRKTAAAERQLLPVWYEAVGTVKSVRRIEVAAQIQARIASIGKRAGDTVTAGETLAQLDDAEFQSRMRQAKQGVAAAQAALLQAGQALSASQAQVRQMAAHKLQAEQTLVQTQAQLAQAEAGLAQAGQGLAAATAKAEQATSEYNRTKKLKDENAATQQQLEAAESTNKQALAGVETAKQGVAAAQAQVKQLGAAVQQAKDGVSAAQAQVEQTQAASEQAKEGVSAAEAHVKRAEEVVNETGIALQYAVIKAPEDGLVAERMAEPGDLAWPGKPLLILHNPRRLRLEANVPEGLLDKVEPGTELPVLIDALKLELRGKVDEVVPSGDPRSRTFLVKALLPERDRLLPGMFGRLRVREYERETILAPVAAVRRVGQLEAVRVKTDQGWRERFVRTGIRLDGRIEVLSGLSGNEVLGMED
jgi:RND family efflux transporter MFP subunit